MRQGFLAGTAMRSMSFGRWIKAARGVTLIELVIVMGVLGILVSTAVPSYRSYMLRTHRTEAIGMLLQASMCQERVYAARGTYDTSQCFPGSEYQRYQLAYEPPDTLGRTYVVVATPVGPQVSDPCGSLSLDQSGARNISASSGSVTKCWSGR